MNLALPPEIKTLIASQLDRRDMLSYRLVNKEASAINYTDTSNNVFIRFNNQSSTGSYIFILVT